MSLLDESGMEWLRPLARYAAVLVPAARGEWGQAEEHLRAGAAAAGDYELMVVTAALARAQVAVARGEQETVLRALEPVLTIAPRAGVDEPGFWPWPDVFAEALISAGRLDEAEALLVPHEELAAARGRAAWWPGWAGRAGDWRRPAGSCRTPSARTKARLDALENLLMPFERAQVELAYGQALRRGGQRRAAAAQLQAARDRFAALRAAPFLERCERELRGCGLTPGRRSDFDPGKLTAQEQAVARLVAVGMSNRQVAAELFVSVKTVQFHLTHIYAKLGIGSRAELAAQFRDQPRSSHPGPEALT